MNTRRAIAFYLLLMLMVVVTLTSCTLAPPPLPQPHDLVAPTPITGNTGTYMCPYTQDEVLAEWVDKAIKAKMGAAIGRIAGTIVGQELGKRIPIVGGIVGGMIGEKIGRAAAIKMCGGWKYIKSTSDLSLTSPDHMAVYLYVKHSRHDHYDEALKATFEIYPKLKNRYGNAIRNAQRR